MLTERQQKFYSSIVKCTYFSSRSSDEEKKYLTIAKNSIDSGKDFKDSINTLNRALKALYFGKLQEGGLTPDVKKLFDSLVSIYGEPEGIYDDYSRQKWEREAQPDWEYTGGGGRSGWRKTSERQETHKSSQEFVAF